MGGLDVSPSQVLIGAFVALLFVGLGWYIVSSQLGRRRANHLMRSVAELLRPLGSAGTLRRLGGGWELRLDRVRQPFRSVQAIVWIESRQFLPIWLLNRSAGRQDLIGLAVDLINPPRVEFELVNPRTAVGRRALRKASARQWQQAEVAFRDRATVLASPDLPSALTIIESLRPNVPPGGFEILRLGVSSRSPELSLSLGRAESLIADQVKLADWLRRVARSIATR